MTTSPGPARRALTCGITPVEYADELREAFETLAWIDRIQRHRAKDSVGPRDPQRATARLLVSQYHNAVQLDDVETAVFVQSAVEHVLGVVTAHIALRDGA